MVVVFAKTIGDSSCEECTENDVNQSHGLRLTVMGTLHGDKMVEVTSVHLPSEVTCPNGGNIPTTCASTHS